MADPSRGILNLFAGAAKARQLYPEGHPARLQAQKSFLSAVAPYLRNQREAVIGVVEETLVFEDHPIYDATPTLDELLRLLMDLEIKAIHFRRGFKPEDLAYLIALLAEDATQEEKGVGIAKRVERATQDRIRVLPEVPDAHEVYGETIGYIGDLLGELRMGQIPKPERAVEVTSKVTECVLKNDQAILGLTMIKSYDHYLFNHSVNVCVLSLALARAAGLQEPELTAVGLGALLHDVGKVRIPQAILSKPGKLTAVEWDVMKTHSRESYNIICEMGKLPSLTGNCALEHHVQYDHQGYPNLGPGKKAHDFSHLVAIADCYDAITTLRNYQVQRAPFEALRMMDRLVGTKLHPDYFKTFVIMLGLYPPGSVVRLDTNEIGVVVENRAEAMSEPRIRIIRDPRGRILEETFDVDLAVQTGEGPLRTIVGTIDPTLGNIDVSRYLETDETRPSQR